MRALLVLLAGCSGASNDLALGEPIVVRGATFEHGALPVGTGPAITLVETANSAVRLGQASKKLDGRASTDAAAIGVAFAGLGTGYWVLPVGPPDPTAGNEYTWTVDASIGWDLPVGAGAIDVVALDGSGRAGPHATEQVCVRPDLLDNFASCDPSLAPPDTVIALAWDTDVDLDLIVVTPDAKIVGPAHPSTVAHEPVTAADLAAPGVGVLDRDSNGGCVLDGIDREALVWQTAPEEGTYLVYADLADACDARAVQFTATVYRSDGDRLVEVSHQDGRLIASEADGGKGPGLFLMQLAL